jgi:hypothetical protein
MRIDCGELRSAQTEKSQDQTRKCARSDFTVTNSASVNWHQKKYRISVARTSPPPRVGAGPFIHLELEVSSRLSVLSRG